MYIAAADFTTGLAPDEMFRSLVQVIVVLILIIGMIIVTIKLLAKGKGAMSGHSMRLLGGMALGQNKTLQLVEIGNAIYILGVGENIQLIQKIEDADEIELLLHRMSATSAETSLHARFSAVVQQLFRRSDDQADNIDAEHISGSSFQQVFHDKMKRVSGRKRLLDDWMNEENEKRAIDK